MGDWPLTANIKFEQVKYGRSTIYCESRIEQVWVAVGHDLRCYSSESGWRSAGTCDVNRASVVRGRPLLAMLIEQVWFAVGHYLRC